MITITAEQIERVNLILSGVPGGIEKALSSTIRRANNTVRSETLKGITTVYAITRQNVRAETTIKVRTQSSDGGIVGTVLFAGHKIPLYRFNVPLIPRFATGTDRTPDTFIAGEQGAELITNAKNRSVFTAAQTGSIFRNLADTVNAIRTAGAAPYQLAYAGAPSVAAPTLNAGGGRTSVVIHSAPVFHVGNDAQAQDIEDRSCAPGVAGA